MANEQIKNAVTLVNDQAFRDWIMVGMIFQAKAVVAEDPATANHTLRLQFAQDILVEPDNSNFIRRMQNIIAVDTDVNIFTGVDAGGITQPLILSKIAFYWNSIANLIYNPS